MSPMRALASSRLRKSETPLPLLFFSSPPIGPSRSTRTRESIPASVAASSSARPATCCVCASLDSLATAAGLEPARVAPFLEQTGVQADLDAAALMDVQIFPDVDKQGNMSRAVVDIVPGPERADPHIIVKQPNDLTVRGDTCNDLW